MATYKVIQDVEAEDKLLGPLTLRQFVYAAITMTCLWLGYFVISKGVGFLAIIFIPPALISAFFAFPWSREQSTELWALARLRFLFKPRKRIWNQSGVKDLVTVTVPKRVQQVYTDGLSQYEVKSRLQALASTIDSRGWAVKGGYGYGSHAGDRLLQLSSQQPSDDAAFPDMMDPATNAVARQFDTMLNSSAQQHRQKLMDAMQVADSPVAGVLPQPTQALDTATATAQQTPQTNDPRPDYWFMNQSANEPPKADPAKVVSPGLAADPYVQAVNLSKSEEAEIVEALKARNVGYGQEYSHLPTILPLAEQEKLAKKRAAEAAFQQEAEAARERVLREEERSNASAVTDHHDAAILELARNDDFNVETIARQAKKAQSEIDDDDEVVIPLH